MQFRIFILTIICFLGHSQLALAQSSYVPGNPLSLDNAPQKDTSRNKNASNWHDESVKISYTTLQDNTPRTPDTALAHFHRRPFLNSWYKDLGNMGSAMRNLYFMPDNYNHTGMRLGYNLFDTYRFSADSLLYYNTTRPYSSFTFNLGSKLEQRAVITHTQNIKPNWNFAVAYQRITSPGFYSVQRINHDNVSLSSIYHSPNQHYNLKFAFVYNVQQQDENGGILADSFLSDSRYSDRKNVPILFENTAYSTRRSSLTNRQRDLNIILQHAYTWGRRDTVYNNDSTEYYTKLVPRFRIAHKMEVGSQRYQWKYLKPDSAILSPFFNNTFATNDSVYSEQHWFWLDNRLMLEGAVGKANQQTNFTLGAGSRVDNFYTDYVAEKDKENNLNNYIVGSINKEAQHTRQWSYKAFLQMYLTGPTAGNFIANASINKRLGNIGTVEAGFSQQLSAPAYNQRHIKNRYYTQATDLKNESVTRFFGSLRNERYKIGAGISNYVLANYIYLASANNELSNGILQVKQASSGINITQLWIDKAFRVRNWVLYNQFVYQQTTADAPVGVPQYMAIHQLSYEHFLFKGKLQMATGIDFRYNSKYHTLGYSPFYSRYYYQQTFTTTNVPEASIFFNFKVKRFRAYVMGDQMQRIFTKTPNVSTPGYPSQDMMIRFGFDWVMLN